MGYFLLLPELNQLVFEFVGDQEQNPYLCQSMEKLEQEAEYKNQH